MEPVETSPLSKLLWRHLPQSPTDEPLTPRFRELRQFCCFVFSAQTSRLKRELCSAGILPDVIIRQPQMDDCHCVTLSYTTPSPHCWKSMCLPEWKVMVGVGMFSQSSDWHNRKLAKQDLSPQRRWSQVGGEAFLLWHRGSDTNTEAHLLLGKDRPTTFANLTNQRAPSSLASIIPKV